MWNQVYFYHKNDPWHCNSGVEMVIFILWAAMGCCTSKLIFTAYVLVILAWCHRIKAPSGNVNKNSFIPSLIVSQVHVSPIRPNAERDELDFQGFQKWLNLQPSGLHWLTLPQGKKKSRHTWVCVCRWKPNLCICM